MAKNLFFWTENTKSNHLKLMIFYQKKAEIIQNNVPFFFLFTKIQKFTKIWLKKRFFGVWNDSCQYPKFLGFAKIWKLPNLPKMSKWSKSILDFFLLIFMKNMTFHVSHATQELLGKQKMSKMFRSDHKSNFIHLIKILPPPSGPFSCLKSKSIRTSSMEKFCYETFILF